MPKVTLTCSHAVNHQTTPVLLDSRVWLPSRPSIQARRVTFDERTPIVTQGRAAQTTETVITLTLVAPCFFTRHQGAVPSSLGWEMGSRRRYCPCPNGETCFELMEDHTGVHQVAGPVPVQRGFDGSSAAPLGEFVVGQWVEHNLQVVEWLRLGSWLPACLFRVSERWSRGALIPAVQMPCRSWVQASRRGPFQGREVSPGVHLLSNGSRTWGWVGGAGLQVFCLCEYLQTEQTNGATALASVHWNKG